VVDQDTGEVLAPTGAQVKLIEFTSKALGSQPEWPPNRADLRMFVVYNDPESDDEVTAFHVNVSTIDRENKIATAPGVLANMPEVKQILDTFEVLADSSGIQQPTTEAQQPQPNNDATSSLFL